MFKFIHIGDVHLDTSFYSKDKKIREKLRASLRESFQGVIETCIKEKVNALLIAGDLFDNNQLSFQTEQLLINSFNQLKEKNIKVYYVTGNHDPGDDKLRVNSINWPDNVTVFKDDKILVVEVLDEKEKAIAKIVGVGHKNAKEARNLIMNFPTKEGDLPVVGLVHSMVTNANDVERHDRYLPCTKEDLIKKGYDYWALGHIHQWQQIGEDHGIYYCGNLQGRHPGETGEKGGLLVTIKPQLLPKVEFRKFSKINWNTLPVNGLEEISTYSQLKDYLIEVLGIALGAEGPLSEVALLRIELKGRSKLKEELQLEENITQLEEDLKYQFNLMALEIKTEELWTLENVDAYKDGENVLAKILELLEDLDKDEVLMERLLKINYISKGIKSTVDKIQYIKDHSSHLQEEAVNRMVGEMK